jgi:hypothetical protein
MLVAGFAHCPPRLNESGPLKRPLSGRGSRMSLELPASAGLLVTEIPASPALVGARANANSLRGYSDGVFGLPPEPSIPGEVLHCRLMVQRGSFGAASGLSGRSAA